jgi:DNA (cytosine-5)-methyltransferase 1
MGTVIRALEERGYSIAWRVLDAQHYGVAQRRRRVFIVGNLGDDWRTPAEILAIAESSARYSEQSNTKRKDATGSTTKSTPDNNRAGNFELYDFPKESISPTLNARRAHDTMTYSEVARMQGFGEYEMDEISGALKARDYKDATDLVIQPTFFYAKNHQDVRIQGDVINTLAATMGTGGGNTPMVHAIQNTVIGRKDTSGPQGKGYGEEDDPMFTLDTTSPHAIAFHLTQTPVSGEISPTMGSSPGGMGMITNSTVRRLTPTECERLQGFPDHWTEGQADSHRYKQLGNAVAVPVVEWIIKRFIQATN